MPRPNPGYRLSDEPNANGYFEIRWTESGRSYRRSTGTGNRREAQIALAAFILDKDKEPTKRWLISDVFRVYSAEKMTAATREKESLAVFASYRGHLLSYFGDMAVTDIVVEDITRYVALRKAGKVSWIDERGKAHGGRVSTDTSLRRELTALVTALNYLAKTKRMKRDDLPFIPLPPSNPPRDRYLERAEARRLLTAAQPDPRARLTRAYRFIAVGLYTAARRQVIYSLPWDRIDLKRGLIDFQKPGRRRTGKRRGRVPIGAELRPILERAWIERETDFFLDSPTMPAQEFDAAVAAAGLEGVTPHILRHTWATWAAQDGVSMFDIAGVLHDSVITVTRNYAHHSPAHLRSAVDRKILAQDSGVTPESVA